MHGPDQRTQTRAGRHILHNRHPRFRQRKNVIPPIGAVGIRVIPHRRRGAADLDGRRVTDHRLQAREEAVDRIVHEPLVAQALVKRLDGVRQSAGVQSAQCFQLCRGKRIVHVIVGRVRRPVWALPSGRSRPANGCQPVPSRPPSNPRGPQIRWESPSPISPGDPRFGRGH